MKLNTMHPTSAERMQVCRWEGERHAKKPSLVLKRDAGQAMSGEGRQASLPMPHFLTLPTKEALDNEQAQEWKARGKLLV